MGMRKRSVILDIFFETIIYVRLGHTKLMFRITDFSGHCLGGEGGIKIKIKLTERRLRSMQNQNHVIVNNDIQLWGLIVMCKKNEIDGSN